MAQVSWASVIARTAAMPWLASTDSDELVRLAHRVLVLQQGRVVRTLHRDDDLSIDELNHAQLARTAGGDRP